MATRVRRDRVEVHRRSAPEIVPSDAPEPPGAPEDSAETTAAGPDDTVLGHLMATAAEAEEPVPDELAAVGEDPEMYGVRISWQSEAVRIEAAEFLVATRVQESTRRRLARLGQAMRDQARAQGRGA